MEHPRMTPEQIERIKKNTHKLILKVSKICRGYSSSEIVSAMCNVLGAAGITCDLQKEELLKAVKQIIDDMYYPN